MDRYSDLVSCVCVCLAAGKSSSARAAAAVAGLPVSPGPLFMLRVVGTKFSFYSTQLSSRFLKLVGDYSMDDIERLPETLVWKCAVEVPYAAAVGGTLTQDQWQLQLPADRKHIIIMLDQILQIIRDDIK